VNQTLQRMERRMALACGATAALIGLFDAAAELLHVPRLFGLPTAYAAMQFDTAIGLVIAGLGLALVERRARAAAWCGFFCAGLGAAMLAEYGLRVNLGIDLILDRAGAAAEVAGRMSVNSAACFLLLGIALACGSLLPRLYGKAALFGGYGLLVIAGSALTGYGLNIEIAYRWDSQTRMSIVTAAAFLLLGVGLFQAGWKRVTSNRTMWLTLLVAGVVAGTSILTWAAVNMEYRKMGRPQVVPDLMLFTGLTRACIAAIMIFLWRNSRERLSRVEVLNTDLQDQVTERTAQLNAIFDAVRVGTWSIDMASNRADFQGQIGPIFGLPGDAPVLGLDDLLKAVHPDDLRKLR
jgi:PAS domain-containing protein